MVTAALVVLAGLAVLPLVAEPDRAAPADPPTPSGAQFSQFTLTGPNSGVDVRQDGCVVRFAYTGDGGRSWSDWDAARFEGTRCAADTAAGTPGSGTGFSVLGERSYLVTDFGLAHLSTDYGRTWRDADSAIVAVPTFPATARPVLCGFGCAPVSEPLAVDPSSGTVYRLTTPAPTLRPLFSLYPAADGSIWATYRTGGGQGSTVARSADRGATWTTWEVGDDAERDHGGRARRPGRVRADPVVDGGWRVRLLRTTDGAKTWTDTGADLPTRCTTTSRWGRTGPCWRSLPVGAPKPTAARGCWSAGTTGGPSLSPGSTAGSSARSVSRPATPGSSGVTTGRRASRTIVIVTTDATTWTRFSLAP